MTIVDIYCRTAINDQNCDNRLNGQEQACRKYCLDNELIVGMVFREIFSGIRYKEREQLSIIRRRYQLGVSNGVVVTTLDRLSRHQLHLILLIDEMEQHGAVLYTAKEDLASRINKPIQALLADVVHEKEKGF